MSHSNFTLATRLRMELRKWMLNRQPGISVSKEAFIANSARLQLRSDGILTGGRIRVDEGAILSDGVILAAYGGNIHIGKNVYVGPYCVLYGHGGLTVDNDTLIAAHTVIIPSNHVFCDLDVLIREQSEVKLGVVIEENVWIGCGVKILDGVTIGRGCVVGAGAVVNKSIAENSVSVGVPARVIRKRA